jgi:hypothetical protein
MNLTMNHAGMGYGTITTEAVQRLAKLGVRVNAPEGLPRVLHVGTIGDRAMYVVKVEMTFASGKVDDVWAGIEIAPGATWVHAFADQTAAIKAANFRLTPY